MRLLPSEQKERVEEILRQLETESIVLLEEPYNNQSNPNDLEIITFAKDKGKYFISDVVARYEDYDWRETTLDEIRQLIEDRLVKW